MVGFWELDLITWLETLFGKIKIKYMKRFYSFALLFAIACLVSGIIASCNESSAASRAKTNKPKQVKTTYYIHANGDKYETKSYTKDSLGCVRFNAEVCGCGGSSIRPYEVCGSYTIETVTE